MGIMTRDFCIRLTFAVHRVVNALGNEALSKLLKESANAVLADFVFLTDNGIIPLSQKKVIADRMLQQVEKMEYLFWGAKGIGTVPAENFSVLERGYEQIKAFCKSIPESSLETRPVERLEEKKPSYQDVPKKHGETSKEISSRQNRILELLRTKEKAQVWELQKVFPEVTKRTLRRDLDDLLEKKLVERHGEWNAVFYRMNRQAQP